jgi:hypothetical protein
MGCTLLTSIHRDEIAETAKAVHSIDEKKKKLQ